MAAEQDEVRGGSDQFMENPIRREMLSLCDGAQLHYSFYRETDKGGHHPPLLICLHPGWEGDTPSLHYGEQFLSSIFIPAFAKTGAMLAAPDCPAGAWNNPKSKQGLLELLDHLVDQHEIDATKVSLVGYSAGAWGVWYTLLDSAERFASAIVFASLPVMEPSDRIMNNFPKSEELIKSRLDEWIKKFPLIPIYMIHSDEDELFPHAYASLAHQALEKDKRQVRFDTLHGVGHFDGGGYIEPLRKSVPWLIETWES